MSYYVTHATNRKVILRNQVILIFWIATKILTDFLAMTSGERIPMKSCRLHDDGASGQFHAKTQNLAITTFLSTVIANEVKQSIKTQNYKTILVFWIATNLTS